MASQATATGGAFATETEEVGRSAYLYVIAGVVSLAIGVLILAYPEPSVALLGVFVGIDLLIAAVGGIIRGSTSLADDGTGQEIVLLGVVGLIAGVAAIRNPEKSITLLAVALAIYLIVAGALALSQAIISRGHRIASLLRGLVLVGLGSVIVCWPGISLDALVWLSGIAMCLQGALDIFAGVLVRATRPAPQDPQHNGRGAR